jgi:hypothetical protein
VATPKGPGEYPIDKLEPDRFEALVSLLARAHDPAVVRVRNKDFGLDARLPDARGRTLRGWQAKRFTEGIQWAKCRESVKRALAFWRPPRITFCFAHDLSAKEQRQFSTELVDQFPEVRLDFWGASELQRRLRDTDEGRRAAAWLFSGSEISEEAMRRAYAAGGPLKDSRQASERQAVIQEFMDRDPHVHYTTISRSAGGPETPPAPHTFMSVTLAHDGQEVRFDGSARYPGALDDLGSRPQLIFSDDESGRHALQAVERVMREGGRATITSGMGTVLDVVPVGLRGLFPEEGLWGEVEVIAEDQPRIVAQPETADPMAGPLLVRCGETELGVVMAPTEVPADWEHAVHGSTGGLGPMLVARRGEEKGQAEMSSEWRFTHGEGSAREQLLATRTVLAALGGAPLELFRPSGVWLARGVMEPPDDAVQWREVLQGRQTFLEYVTEAEAWLGRELFPPAAPTEADAKALGAIVELIREPEASITWTRVEMASGAAAPEGDGPWRFAFLQPLWADLFGERIYVGMEFIVFPEGRIDARREHLAIVPVGDTGHGTSRLHHPDEVPPEAALSPAAREAASPQASVRKVGRNEPCPCGSRRKYKKCHGR